MYKSKEVTLGSFEIQSNEIYISDPCYEYDENDNSCVLTCDHEGCENLSRY